MILDKLIEKKDLDSYIKMRIGCLRHNKSHIKDLNYRSRGEAKFRYDGAIKELEFLRKNIHTLQEVAIKNWKYKTQYYDGEIND